MPLRIVMCLVSLSVLLSSSQNAQAAGKLVLGKEFKGDFAGKEIPNLKAVYGRGVDGLPTFRGFGTQLSVKLKKGQGVEIKASVSGDNRKVYVSISDPNGAPLTFARLQLLNAEISVSEASMAGDYKIVVASDRAGGFSVTATDPDSEPEDEQTQDEPESIEALKKRIASLRKQLKDAELKLEIAESKTQTKSEEKNRSSKRDDKK